MTPKNRVRIDGDWHIALANLSSLQDMATSSGQPIRMPARGFSWATLRLGSVRFAALVGGHR